MKFELFLIGFFLSFMKLIISNNMVTMLICMELMMTSILVVMLVFNNLWCSSYLLITFICLLVCEGTIGLSIMSSISKSSCDDFLFKFTSAGVY